MACNCGKKKKKPIDNIKVKSRFSGLKSQVPTLNSRLSKSSQKRAGK